MAALYPSLEDMKVGQMMQAQTKESGGVGKKTESSGGGVQSVVPSAPPVEAAAAVVPRKPSGLQMALGGRAVPVYPSLLDYMGLDLSGGQFMRTTELSDCQSAAAGAGGGGQSPLSAAAVTTATSLDTSQALLRQQPQELAKTNFNNMVAPLSGNSVGLKRAHVTNGIRELILCKDKEGKVGVRVASVNSGIFVSLVARGSPAEMAGLRFGDQLLEINGSQLAGYTVEQVHKLFKKSPVNGISVVVRDRPLERTVTLHKDSGGRVGFQFKRGEIVSLVKESSATRNGLLTGHQLLEVQGQNVVGLKDREITALIEAAQSPLTVTIIPLSIYEHIVSKMSSNLIKNLMSHNIPDV